jgi:hypothetical protein
LSLRRELTIGDGTLDRVGSEASDRGGMAAADIDIDSTAVGKVTLQRGLGLLKPLKLLLFLSK